MKKILLFIAGLIFTSLSMHAATGWYSDYIKINVSGAGTAGPTGWYWIGGNPGYATQLAGTNFGTASSLVITGCDMKYWSDTQDRTGGSFFYKIMTSDNTTQIIAPVETIWSQAYLGGNDYQGTTTVSINLFTGLSASTTYNLHVWAKHWGTGQGDNYLSNGGANYIATFTTPAAPVAYNVTGSGSYCEGGSGLAVGLDNSEAGTTYKLYKSTDLVTPVATVTPVAAGAFSFGTFAAGTYTATGTNAISTANMSGSAVISMDPLPLTGSILGSADVTEGDVLVPYTVSIAYATSYTWSYTGTGVTINGIGSAVTLDIAFGATSGSLKVTGHNACGDGAESSLAITVHLYIAPPTVFSVTGSGTYCEGSGGRSVGLDDSEAGVTYKLYKSTDLLTPIATVTPLVSGAFSFGTFSAGTYTATGTNAGGTTAMDGSAIIGEVMLPVASGSIVGPAHVTEGMTIDYSATVSYATNYSWNYSGTGVTINGNGSPNVSLDFAMGATSGQLSVSGSNSCGAIDLNLDITVITVPTSST